MSVHINPSEITHLSNLAKLQLLEAEEQSLTHDLGQILDYVSVLQSVQVDGIVLDPRVHLLSELRPDEARSAGIALPELLPEHHLVDSLLQTPNVFTSNESAESDHH